MGGSATSFKFSKENCPTFNKDVATLTSEKWIDENGNLTPEHDAATVKLGPPWRMMTEDELRNLNDPNVCKREWTENYNGTDVSGCLVTGNTEGYKDKSIFLPAAGYDSGDNFIPPPERSAASGLLRRIRSFPRTRGGCPSAGAISKWKATAATTAMPCALSDDLPYRARIRSIHETKGK